MFCAGSAREDKEEEEASMSTEYFVGASDRFAASTALILYERQSVYGNSGYVTIHKIVDDKLREGVPITKGALESLARKLMPGLRPTPKFLPDRVLCYCENGGLGTDMLVWWRPPGWKLLLFTAGCGVPTGKTPLPGLVFMQRGRGLSVWAVKGNSRPLASEMLYHLPLSNIDSTGAVCMGNVRQDFKPVPDAIDKIEKAFFSSAFSPHHVTKKIGKESFSDFWTNLITTKKKEFPLAVLEPTKRTIQALLKKEGD